MILSLKCQFIVSKFECNDYPKWQKVIVNTLKYPIKNGCKSNTHFLVHTQL